MDGAKDLVRNALHIEDVIGNYVTLVPAGKNFKACCPFHNEKTASFNINTDKQMFYCFGCKKGGDLFTFVQEIERVDFKESLRILADRAGIDLKQSVEITRDAKQKKILMEIHEYATRFYQLILSKQTNVLEYLKSRGMTAITVKQWRVGYVPDGFSSIIPVMTKKGFKNEDLVASGLAIQSERGIYDRFRARVMFPICDPTGKIIAFSGRIMPGTREGSRDGVGKYINSPETLIYHKSSALFGFHHAKSSIAKQKSVIIVEGQFDCILLHQAGFAHTVAISGTACTEKHMEQLARFATEIIIATDPDRAGVRSAYQIAALAYQFGLDVSVIILPEGKDPADIVSEDPKNFKSLLDTRKDYITFHGESTSNEPLRERLRSIETYLFPAVMRMTNPVEQDSILTRIARMLEVTPESIRKEFERFTKRPLTAVLADIAEVDVSATSSPLSVQLYELALIHQYFPETQGWFDDHPEPRKLAEDHAKIAAELAAEKMARFSNLDISAWNIRLDTLWLRIQQIHIDAAIDIVRKSMQKADSEKVSKLQRELMSLRQEKEALIKSLSD